MAAYLVARVSRSLSNFEDSLVTLLRNFFPPGSPGFAVAGVELPLYPSEEVRSLDNHILRYAVPTKRASLERRMKKRFGSLEGVYKMLREKKNLLQCQHCGNWHEPGLLCAYCYHKVMNETKDMQKKIREALKLDPVDKEVVVLYDKETPAKEFVDGKRIIEMEKPRPSWFAPNLLQSTTQETNEEVKDVKINDAA